MMAVDCEPFVEEWDVEDELDFLDGFEGFGKVVEVKCEFWPLQLNNGEKERGKSGVWKWIARGGWGGDWEASGRGGGAKAWRESRWQSSRTTWVMSYVVAVVAMGRGWLGWGESDG